MKIKFALWLTSVAILLPLAFASAHPGHGNNSSDGNSVWHFVSEPVHLLSFGIIIMLFMAGRYFYLRAKSRHR